MKLTLTVIALVHFFIVPFSLGEVKGFEDPHLLKRVMRGEIVITNIIDTKLESKLVARSFFNHVSPEAYMDLTVSYERYPELFREIKEGRMLSSNTEKTLFTYKLDLLVDAGLFQQHVYPEGRHTFEKAKDAISESIVHNTVTNYQQNIDKAEQTIRLIPYEGGMLVEDSAHVKISKSMAFGSLAKDKFKSFFMSYTKRFRDELKGND